MKLDLIFFTCVFCNFNLIFITQMWYAPVFAPIQLNSEGTVHNKNTKRNLQIKKSLVLNLKIEPAN